MLQKKMFSVNLDWGPFLIWMGSRGVNKNMGMKKKKYLEKRRDEKERNGEH